jgi:hypothetical protein
MLTRDIIALSPLPSSPLTPGVPMPPPSSLSAFSIFFFAICHWSFAISPPPGPSGTSFGPEKDLFPRDRQHPAPLITLLSAAPSASHPGDHPRPRIFSPRTLCVFHFPFAALGALGALAATVLRGLPFSILPSQSLPFGGTAGGRFGDAPGTLFPPPAHAAIFSNIDRATGYAPRTANSCKSESFSPTPPRRPANRTPPLRHLSCIARSRNWPQAASTSSPRVRRKCATTWRANRTSKKRFNCGRGGRR